MKTLLATGGWNAGSVPFSEMVTDVNLRKKFASTSVEFVRDWGFDGLDLDWEYPAMRGGLPGDKNNFIELLKVCMPLDEDIYKLHIDVLSYATLFSMNIDNMLRGFATVDTVDCYTSLGQLM